MARRYSGEAFTQEFVLLFGFLSGLWFYAGLKPFRHIYIVNSWGNTPDNEWPFERGIFAHEHVYLVLNVPNLIMDIKQAWERLRNELQQNEEMSRRAADALTRLPLLM